MSIINFFNKQPIKIKLMLIIMLICSISLIVTGSAFVIYERYHIKQNLIRDISALSLLIAEKSSDVLKYQDISLAEENLSMLRAEPSVVAACILNDRGNLFVSYRTRDGNAIVFPPE